MMPGIKAGGERGSDQISGMLMSISESERGLQKLGTTEAGNLEHTLWESRSPIQRQAAARAGGMGKEQTRGRGKR